MIYGPTHPGSGIGNQLFRYIATRVLALEKGYEFSIIGREFFKGKDFMNLDIGQTNDVKYRVESGSGKIIVTEPIKLWEEKTNYYNPEFNFLEDETLVDGEFQSEQYFGNYLPLIDEWLSVEPLSVPDDVCLIGFRGGEYYVFPELGLPKEYFEKGIELMREINPNMRFEVHTDDPLLATTFFPDYKIIRDIGINWRSMRFAKHAIIANSSFYIFPRLLRNGVTLAPRGWARRNIGEWLRPDNYYKSFKYI